MPVVRYWSGVLCCTIPTQLRCLLLRVGWLTNFDDMPNRLEIAVQSKFFVVIFLTIARVTLGTTDRFDELPLCLQRKFLSFTKETKTNYTIQDLPMPLYIFMESYNKFSTIDEMNDVFNRDNRMYLSI